MELTKNYPISCVKTGSHALADLKKELAERIDCNPDDIEVLQISDTFKVFVNAEQQGALVREGRYFVQFEKKSRLPYSSMQ